MWRLTRIERAVTLVCSRIRCEPRVVSLPLLEAIGRFSACGFKSRIRFPPYPKSTMDGFAVRAEDVSGASRNSPIALKLRLLDTVPNVPVSVRIASGECVPIETGAYLPQGADAVVKVEDTDVSGDIVYVYRGVGRFENVSLPGEELEVGDIILEYGRRIRPWMISALAFHRVKSVKVLDLRIKLIIVGDEFIHGFHIPFTKELIKGWFIEFGFPRVHEVIVGDNVNDIMSEIEKGLRDFELIIICGGTSIGKRDYSVKAIEGLGPDVFIHGLALQPGKTTCLSVISGKPVLAISGLPAAAMANLELVIARILARWLNLKDWERVKIMGVLRRRVTSKLGLVSFIRVKAQYEPSGVQVYPILTGGSGSIRSLLLSNGYIVVPEDVEGYDEGETVEVNLYSFR